jgi:PST family polysaccharide transporter
MVFVVNILSTMALARLLAPEDFGLLTMAAVVVNLAVLFQNIGLDTATIQAPKINHQQVSTLFWVNVGIGGLLMMLVMACAPLAALFFRRPELTGIVAALGPCFLFSSAMLQHQALLRRRMLFTRLGLVRVVSVMAAAGAAVVVAWLFASYWALVVQRVVQSFLFAAAMWAACPWLPRRPRKTEGVGSMLSFGGHLTGSRFVEYAMRNADNLLIGKQLGGGPLGVYAKAYSLLLLPLRQLNSPFSSVVTPALSRLTSDPPRFVAYYRKALNTLTFLGMPVVVLSAVAAPEIIGVILGDQWAEAVPVFLCLAPAAFAGTSNVATSWVFIAFGRTDRQLRLSVFTFVVGITAMLIGLRGGLLGMACAISAATFLFRPVQLIYCFRGTAVSVRDFLAAVARPAASSLLAGAGVFALSRGLPDGLPAWGGLAVKAAVYGLLYPGVYAALPGGWAEMRRCLGSLRALKSSAQRGTPGPR